MGNHRFRLSDMMPNAWFYKLRDMSRHTRRRNCDPTHGIRHKTKSSPQPCHPSQNSFYSSNTGSHMTLAQHMSLRSPARNPPGKSPNRLMSAHRNSVYKPCTNPKTRVSVTYSRGSNRIGGARASWVWSDCDQDALYYSISPCCDHLSSPSSDPFDEVGSWSSSSPADIIININHNRPPLPPILTKTTSAAKKRDERRPSVSRKTGPRRRASLALRGSSRRSSISDGLAVIKCSYDPEKDFEDSMREMVVQHHINASRQLEELLARYLTLNSEEYHHLIVKAFEQIWCEMLDAPVSTAQVCR